MKAPCCGRELKSLSAECPTHGDFVPLTCERSDAVEITPGGRFTLGKRKCFTCGGDGVHERTSKKCPGPTKKNGYGHYKKCECGGDGYFIINVPNRQCTRCDGTGYEDETWTSSINQEQLEQFPFAVFVADRSHGWAEHNLGVGLHSCTDYGTGWKLCEAGRFLELVEKERIASPPQLSKVSTKDGKVADILIIVVNHGGYSVVPGFCVGFDMVGGKEYVCPTRGPETEAELLGLKAISDTKFAFISTRGKEGIE